MTLKEYKDKYGYSVTRLAKLLDIPRTTVYQWLSGAANPYPKNALKVYQKTKGEVTLNEQGI